MDIVKEFGSRVVYNLGANTVIDATGISRMFAGGDDFKSCLKQGALIYLVTDAERVVLNGSDFNTNVVLAADEAFFNGLTIFLLKKTQLDDVLQDAIPSIGGNMQQLLFNSTIMAVVQTASDEAEKRIGAIPWIANVRHWGSKVAGYF